MVILEFCLPWLMTQIQERDSVLFVLIFGFSLQAWEQLFSKGLLFFHCKRRWVWLYGIWDVSSLGEIEPLDTGEASLICRARWKPPVSRWALLDLIALQHKIDQQIHSPVENEASGSWQVLEVNKLDLLTPGPLLFFLLSLLVLLRYLTYSNV